MIRTSGGAGTVPCFTLSFLPNAALVSTVRQFVANFYKRWLPPDLTSQVELATHELLDNAVNYSSGGETEVQIEIAGAGGKTVCVRTRNTAGPEHLEVLRAAFAEIDAATEPDVYYQRVLWRSVKRTEGSGLGLARIHAETTLAMELDIVEDQVSISACVIAKDELPRCPSISP